MINLVQGLGTVCSLSHEAHRHLQMLLDCQCFQGSRLQKFIILIWFNKLVIYEFTKYFNLLLKHREYFCTSNESYIYLLEV